MRGPGLFLLLILLAPLCATGKYSYLLPLGQLCGIYAIIATGLTLLMGFAGQVSLGHAGYYGFGAYLAAILAVNGHVPVAVAAPAGAIGAALLALASGWMVLRLKGHHLALATLCIGVILAELINKSKITGGAAGLYDLPEITVFGLFRGGVGKFYLVWFVVWVALTWAVLMTASPVGRALRAVHGDEAAAAALGISVFQVKLKVFVLSGFLAGVAGVLYGFVYTPSYLGPEEFGIMLSVTLVVMAVVGGMGSIWGGVAGAVVMTALHEIITLLWEKTGLHDAARFEQLIYGLMLVGMLIYCPKGLAPVLGRWVKKRLKKD
jgi:branched-chain amino acid transport system permease protein